MAKTTITKILFRRGSDYDRKPTILDEGEPGWVTDSCRLYVGDGRTEGGFPVLNIRTPENAPLHAYNNELVYEPLGDLSGTSQPPTQEVLAINHAGLSANITRDWMDDRYVLKDPCETNSLTNPADPVACAPGSTIMPTQIMKANLITEGDVTIQGIANMTSGVAVSGGMVVQNGGIDVTGDSHIREDLDIGGDTTMTGNLQIGGTTTGQSAVFEQLSLNTPLDLASGGTGDTGTSVANWNTAFGWGDHHQYNYLQEADLGPGLVRDPSTGQVNLDFAPTAGLTVGPDGKITKGVARRSADLSAPGAVDNTTVPGADLEYHFIIGGSNGTDTVAASGADIDMDFLTRDYTSGSAVRGVLISPDGEGSMWESVCGAYSWALNNAPGKAAITFLIRHSCHMNHPEDDNQLTGTMNDPRPKGDPQWQRFNRINFYGYTASNSAHTDSSGNVHNAGSITAVQARARIQMNCGVGGLCLWFRGGVVFTEFVRFAFNFSCAGNVTRDGVTTTQQLGNSNLARKSYYYWQSTYTSFTIHPPVNGQYAMNHNPIQAQDGSQIFFSGNCLIDLANADSADPPGQNMFGTKQGSSVVLGANVTSQIMIREPANAGGSYGIEGLWFRVGETGEAAQGAIGTEIFVPPSAISGTGTAIAFSTTV